MEERKGNPLTDFIIVITASGIAYVRIHTTATWSSNEAEKLHLHRNVTKLKILTLGYMIGLWTTRPRSHAFRLTKS